MDVRKKKNKSHFARILQFLLSHWCYEYKEDQKTGKVPLL